MNNKKGKGKRTNKPPNPNPPQVKEVVVPEKEEISEAVEIAEKENEQRVPEIISEVPIPVADTKDENDTPKKPKRNRGKKKKQDKDVNSEDNQDEKSEIPAEEENVLFDKKDDIKVETLEIREQTKDSEVPNITPTARKKKNKNKKHNQEEQVLEKSNLDIAKETIKSEIDNKSKETEVPKQGDVVDTSEQVKHTIETTGNEQIEDSKTSKKKNKKKKHHDGEKNDKKEEITCTAAFQSLLEENVDACKIDLSKDTEQSLTDIDNNSKLEIKEIPTAILEQLTQEEQVIQEKSQDTCNKNKKKKKDKKGISKDDEVQLVQQVEGIIDIIDKEKLPPIIEMASSTISESSKVEQLLIDDKPQTSQQTEEDMSKPKPKIVKPVDKKRKNLKDTLPEDIVISSMPTSDVIALPTVESKNIVPDGDIELLKTSESPISEFISTPACSMGKKRKKSPKLPVETQKETIKEEIKADFIEEQKGNMDCSLLVCEKLPEETTPVTEQISIEQQQPTEGDKKEEEPTKVTQEVKLNVLPETTKGKKGKKSPKLPLKFDNIETKACLSEEKINTEKTEQNKEKAMEVTSEVFYDLPSMDEIEIKSIKTDESGESTSEVTPDSIQYPRAISQQNVDNNNNTVIQELVSEDSRLQIPNVIPDTPFMKSSEYTINSPELIKPSMVKVSEPEASTTKLEEKQEKTDLKSKMMEVNQDMEELRLSIEKSLAELTSLEKTDDKEEKQIEAQTQTKSVKSSEADIKMVVAQPTEFKETDENIEDNTLKQGSITDKLPTPESSMPSANIESGHKIIDEVKETSIKDTETEVRAETATPPLCPARKDHKGKNKSRKKGKQDTALNVTQTDTSNTSSTKTDSSDNSKKEEKTEKKPDTQEKGKQQSINKDKDVTETNVSDDETKNSKITNFEPIENFEDAMTSSIDDVNKTFEMIVDESQESQVNPETNIVSSTEVTNTPPDEKKNPASPSKNLLGHPDIPVPSNKTDYKKEKNKPPNTLLAKVKIKDSVQIESKKESKESQTDNIKNLMKKKSIDESFTSMINENDEYIYKYTFRKVYLPNVCHVCKKDLKQVRISCGYCHLLFYCCPKHKDEDWPQHQALCFAVSTIGHLKDQKHIYADAKNITGHNYRLLRMQMIVSCEKVLKRKLTPWEQEVLLYPRMCTDVACREWRQNKLMDCDGCGQISYCSDHPEHLTRAHQRWCKSYSLYQKLVCYQQTKGRLEPKLPNRVMTGPYYIPEKINEVLASIYTEKIDMNDIEYAALTQLATAPLTAAYCHQLYNSKLNSIYANGVIKNSSFVIHVVGAELQFEADVLNKWEVFFLHLRPDIQELKVVLIAPDLNPSNLPLDLLQKVRLCDDCYQNKRHLLFRFEDKKTYHEYYDSIDFITPDIVCAFNPSIQRSSAFNGKDPWPSTISCILKLKTPFLITAYTLNELRRDLTRVEEICGLDLNLVAEPKRNPFASVRPDRNFITDDEMPLLFKNYCFSVVCGVF